MKIGQKNKRMAGKKHLGENGSFMQVSDKKVFPCHFFNPQSICVLEGEERFPKITLHFPTSRM